MATKRCGQILDRTGIGNAPNTVESMVSGLKSPSQNLPALPKAHSPLDAARNGYNFYKHLQAKDGHWAGEYGGPMFLMPGLVIGSYVSHMGFKNEERLEMIRYLFNHANEDGGWGL